MAFGGHARLTHEGCNDCVAGRLNDPAEAKSNVLEIYMNRSINKLAGLVAASTLAVGAGTVVLAAGNQVQGNYPWMMGGPGMMGMGPAVMGGSVADTTKRLADVKNELGISPKQASAWNAYEQAVISQSALMNAHHQTMMSGPMPPATDQRIAMHQQGVTMMQQRAQAAQGLYQVLTSEQRAKADSLLMFGPGFGMVR
jgi:Spy/CpxP family protein refolding chaperone